MPHVDTLVIHAGEPVPRLLGAVTMPLFQSVTYINDPADGPEGVRYIRYNNTPNHDVLHAKLAALEGAEAAVVTASGMAAITTALLTVLKAGDRVLAQRCLYGGTHGFLSVECPELGIGVDWIDAQDPGSWQRQLTPATRAIYVESMTNPLLEVADLDGVVAFARAHGLVSLIDNTFASPVNFRAVERGFDLSLHSATKYLNGHGDIAAGAVIGGRALVERVTHRLNHLGGCLDPHAAFLLHRGLKTLAVRMRHQNDSGLRVARFLAAHPAVERVNYPGLETHANHARARALFGGFAGTLSFDLVGGSAAADRFMDAVRLPVRAPSLGSVDSLMMRPAAVSHVAMTSEQRAALGIGDGLVRMSLGLEAAEDLIEDFDRALAVCGEVAARR